MAITAVVTVENVNGVSREEMAKVMIGAAPNFRGIDGLHRKNFILDDAGTVGGGVYTWATREQAEKFYASGWRERLLKVFGSEPEIRWFESPVIVDNDQGSITT